ncbi:hypothetical protein ACIPSE_44975 [Streptomyces sp. NPDC090106]|uniref:hypothetical protein n=1 Tax=Streptomyces sp. NPDC090106 TaxID=3365946 RepID=UPI0037FC02DA
MSAGSDRRRILEELGVTARLAGIPVTTWVRDRPHSSDAPFGLWLGLLDGDAVGRADPAEGVEDEAGTVVRQRTGELPAGSTGPGGVVLLLLDGVHRVDEQSLTVQRHVLLHPPAHRRLVAALGCPPGELPDSGNRALGQPVRAHAPRLGGPARRIGAHRRAADHLRSRGAPDVVCAPHLRIALRHGDTEGAAVLVSAALAVMDDSPDTAVTWLRAALRAVPKPAGGAVAGTPWWETRLALARACRRSGRLREAGRCCTNSCPPKGSCRLRRCACW